VTSCRTKFHKNLSLSIKLTFVTESGERSRETDGNIDAAKFTCPSNPQFKNPMLVRHETASRGK